MSNLGALDVATLTITVMVWAALLVSLVVTMRRRQRRSLSLLAGLLAANMGTLLSEITHMSEAPRAILLTADAVTVLLIFGGLACILVGAMKSARPRAES